MDKNKHFSCLYIKGQTRQKRVQDTSGQAPTRKTYAKVAKKQVQKRVKTDKRKEKREKSSLFSNNYLQIKIKEKRKE